MRLRFWQKKKNEDFTAVAITAHIQHISDDEWCPACPHCKWESEHGLLHYPKPQQ